MDFLTAALQDDEVVMSMKDTGLVLEGGGLRGVFTCGVLDCFMDHYIGFRYNRTMDLIERLEDEGRITVIRPLRHVEVGRMEKDTAKLTALYQEGYDIAEKLIEEHSLF